MVSPVYRKGKVSKTLYNIDEWQQYRPVITRMYFREGRTLKEVRRYLEKEYNFTPSERMYKSRLHSWGLDKKKKEHEMREIVRLGSQQHGGNKDMAFTIRGRTVTLADALHYFNRKGIKDPTTLLGPLPDGLALHTGLSTLEDAKLTSSATLKYGVHGSGLQSIPTQLQCSVLSDFKPIDFVKKQVQALQIVLNISELRPMPMFHTIYAESWEPTTSTTQEEAWYIDAIVTQLQEHYGQIFLRQGISVNSLSTATSNDVDAAQFYYHMQCYLNVWNLQQDVALKSFLGASGLIKALIEDDHVAFLIYVLDLVIRYHGSGHEQPILGILQHIAEIAQIPSKLSPIFRVVTHLKDCRISRATVAEGAMRKLLNFFQDSIGYFHRETTTLLQTFATALFNRERYAEAAVRYQQLVDVFETTIGKYCYEVCDALWSTSEVYFHMNKYVKSLQALKAALECSEALSQEEGRVFYIRCVQKMAEISSKLDRNQEAIEIMLHIVDYTREAFGPDHSSTSRAHLTTIESSNSDKVLNITPVF